MLQQYDKFIELLVEFNFVRSFKDEFKKALKKIEDKDVAKRLEENILPYLN